MISERDITQPSSTPSISGLAQMSAEPETEFSLPDEAEHHEEPSRSSSIENYPEWISNPSTRSSSLAYSFVTEAQWTSPVPRVHHYPVRHPSAPHLSLLFLENLPDPCGLIMILNAFNRPPTEVLGLEGDRPSPLWISFNAKSHSALVRFLTPEDAVNGSTLLGDIKYSLQHADDEESEPWLWLLDAEVRVVGDDEVPAAEVGHSDSVEEWLRVVDTVGGSKGTRTLSELRTSFLVEGLPDPVALSDLVAFFVPPKPISSSTSTEEEEQPETAAEASAMATGATPPSAPEIQRITLLDSLVAHGIYRPCCVLHYANHADAQRAVPALPSKFRHLAGEYRLTYSFGKWAEAISGVIGKEIWQKPRRRSSPPPDALDDLVERTNRRLSLFSR